MDIRAILMGVAFSFMWSSAFTSARVAVAYASPLALLSVRFLMSGLIALMIARAMGQSARLTRKQWTAVIIFGICQNVVYLGANFIAVQTVEAGLASIIASMLPLLVAAASWLVLGERLPKLAIAGLVVGFTGVFLIMGTRLSGGADLLGLGLCLVGVLALAAATMLVSGASSGGNIWMVIGLQMLVGSVILGGLSVGFETWRVEPTLPLLVAFLYTTLIPGLTATFVWFTLVRRIGATRASAFHFLNPFFGVVVASVVIGETLGMTDIIGVLVIMAGILAVQLSRRV
ncbi:MAG TPA: DMT family transporter [Paracoccaceae bacterium]|nr:DMT family transporter [Paracoccaceae bacterium]